MSQVHVEVKRVIPAPPNAVYSFLTDYKTNRPRILPANYLDYHVEQGGRGTGTIITYRLRAANRERAYRIRVEEPKRGSVLRETDLNSSLVTTWTLAPLANGQQTHVTLATGWQGGSGVKGFFERTFAPLGLRQIYAETLDNLATALKGQSTRAAS